MISEESKRYQESFNCECLVRDVENVTEICNEISWYIPTAIQPGSLYLDDEILIILRVIVLKI